ncbi:MAG: YraN family protein [Haliea sp.]|jgi:putative endonuclease|nr:YraN family protein [Haliea sp.]
MQTQGRHYEDIAAHWLQARGWRILQRNFRCKVGEIDIIALDGVQLVFVEVRSRSNPRFASAAASVDRRKQQKLLRTANVFLQRNACWQGNSCRFDVLGFDPRQSAADSAPQWIRAAFCA